MLDRWRQLRVVIAGTGTGIGKTHVGCALLRCLRARGIPAVGLKPIETGLQDDGATDQERLSLAADVGGPWDSGSSFHVKQASSGRGSGRQPFHVQPSPYWFRPAVAPHIAASDAGQRIDIGRVRSWILQVQGPDGLTAVIETAGGLFTPIAPGTVNFDLVLALEPALFLLVAPDRLGVLHEITVTLGLAAARGRPVDAVALSAPAAPDASTGRNATELERLAIARIQAVFPRAPEISSATGEAADILFAGLDLALTRPADRHRA